MLAALCISLTLTTHTLGRPGCLGKLSSAASLGQSHCILLQSAAHRPKQKAGPQNSSRPTKTTRREMPPPCVRSLQPAAALCCAALRCVHSSKMAFVRRRRGGLCPVACFRRSMNSEPRFAKSRLRGNGEEGREEGRGGWGWEAHTTLRPTEQTMRRRVCLRQHWHVATPSCITFHAACPSKKLTLSCCLANMLKFAAAHAEDHCPHSPSRRSFPRERAVPQLHFLHISYRGKRSFPAHHLQ